ncbi:MAG: carboxypeptidase-like regulatory domain-containing protein [Planctomycetales bacterium]
MSLRIRTTAACLSLLLVALVMGCNSGAKPPPKIGTLIPVTGTVTLDGVALADATVTFHPESASGFQGSFARTDAQGKYEMESPVGNNKRQKGAIPGKYKVTVSRLLKPDGTPHTDDKVAPMNVGASESIAMKYADAGQTQLMYDVPSNGKGSYDIPLTAKEDGDL